MPLHSIPWVTESTIATIAAKEMRPVTAKAPVERQSESKSAETKAAESARLQISKTNADRLCQERSSILKCGSVSIDWMILSRKKEKKRKRSSVEILGFVAIGLFVVGVIWLLVSAPSSPNPGQTTTLQTSSLATDFTLNDVDGNVFKLSDNRGKVVVLEFMRTTCEACIEQEPRMRELRSNFGDDVVTVMISVDPAGDTDQLLRQHRDQNMAGWIAIRDTSGIYGQYGVQATPTIFIIDKNGYLAYRNVGVTESSILINEVEGLR